MTTVIKNATNIRVSSVLNRDVKQFGKKYMFDGNDETCWNSDQGTPQWVQMDFTDPVQVTEIQIQFQGGFAGKDCQVMGSSSADGDLLKIADIYPEDVNSVQTFIVSSGEKIHRLRIVFGSSTDFFGRITIYKMDVLGKS